MKACQVFLHYVKSPYLGEFTPNLHQKTHNNLNINKLHEFYLLQSTQLIFAYLCRY
ncbi:MAG: hypothetical protein RIR11_1152 [Bacteroidota bacterium]|jgi:hypothetical protein